MNKVEKTIEMFLVELRTLGQIKQVIAKRENALRKLIDQLQSQEMKESVDAETIVGELSSLLKGESAPATGNGSGEDVSWYPLSVKKQQKIIAILQHEGRVMRSPDIEEMIERFEGPDRSKETLKSYWFTLTSMVKAGLLVSCMVNNSKKHNFFALPEWIDGKALPQEYYPVEEAWGNLPEKERTFKNQKWIGGGRR